MENYDFDNSDIDLEKEFDDAKFNIWLNNELKIQPKNYCIKIINYIRKNYDESIIFPMNIIISTKPKYVEKIINYEKGVEFRRVIFKNKDISKIYIYCSYPIKRIIGYFPLGNIAKNSPERLWNKYKAISGLEELEFFKYFENKKIGYAIEINDLYIFDDPLDPLEFIPNFKPPQ